MTPPLVNKASLSNPSSFIDSLASMTMNYAANPASIYDQIDDYDRKVSSATASNKRRLRDPLRRRSNYGSNDHHLQDHGHGAVASLSGYGHSSGGGSGHGGGGSHYELSDPECCPLVVDPLTLGALLAFTAAATALLGTLITTSLGRRKKRSDGSYGQVQMTISSIFSDMFHYGRNINMCMFRFFSAECNFRNFLIGKLRQIFRKSLIIFFLYHFLLHLTLYCYAVRALPKIIASLSNRAPPSITQKMKVFLLCS